MLYVLLMLLSVGPFGAHRVESAPNAQGDPFHSPESLSNRVARDCQELRDASPDELFSGLYHIQPLTYTEPFTVYCDFESDGGGWTVIQRRVDGSVDFYRGWSDYKHGFGNLQTEFWLGNEKISTITAQKSYQLRIELTGKTQTPRYVKYSSFRIGKEDVYYQLFLGSYSGNAGQDSLDYHRNKFFTTHDADHDTSGENCAATQKGGWWFGACDNSNLNGVWAIESDGGGIEWQGHPGGCCAFRFVEMKIRAV